MTKLVVLHVEDSAICREMLRAQFLGRGVRLVQCATLIEARAELAKETPAFAILDLELSPGNGADLLPLPCPVVFVTGDVSAAPPGYVAIEKGRGWIQQIHDHMTRVLSTKGTTNR